jgi:hypothetical protein
MHRIPYPSLQWAASFRDTCVVVLYFRKKVTLTELEDLLLYIELMTIITGSSVTSTSEVCACGAFF